MKKDLEYLDVIIGKNIRTQRESRNLTRDELAEILGLTVGTVGHMEKGTRGATRATLQKLSDIFGMAIDDFFMESVPGSVLAEETDTGVQSKRKKITSLLSGLSETELDFVISTVKSFRKLRYPDMVVDEE